MNKDRLKKNVGFRVQLQPEPIWLDEFGFERPALEVIWIVENVTDNEIRFSNIGTGYFAILGLDHIHDFKTDRSRSQPGGVQYGLLTLTVQISFQNNKMNLKSTFKPGERLPPPLPKVTDLNVDLAYPFDSGLQTKLENSGYRLEWCLESRLARAININGWEIVRERSRDGAICTFRVKDRGGDDLVLIKKR